MRIWDLQNAFIKLQKMFDEAEEMEREEDKLAIQEKILEEWAKWEEALSYKLEGTAAMLKNIAHTMDACKAEKDKFARKQKSAEKQIDFIKNRMILPALKAAQKEKVEAGSHKITIRHSRACDIQDMSAIPTEFIKIEERKSADKREILKRLKEGEKISGAVLLENESVQIK